MDGLILGLDLCDAYTQLVCDQGEKSWTLPTVICRKKEEESWMVGEPAYASALAGSGVMVDKLVKLVTKDGTATIGGIRYTGAQLLTRFLIQAVALAKDEYNTDKIKQLVFSVPRIETRLLACLRGCGAYLDVAGEDIHIMSHTESFMYYVLSQKREVWNNQVGMFDLSGEGLCYYEMKVQRGLRQTTVMAEKERLEEGFSLDILNSSAGKKMADRILCSCGNRMLQKKLFSSVFLMGKGFEERDWAEEFMKLVCNRRRVYVETELFARGAAYRAVDFLREKSIYPYVCICEGRLDSSVSMRVLYKDQDNQLMLAKAGVSWYEAAKEVELILDGQDYLEFMITPPDQRKKKTVRMELEGFPKRGEKTLRVLVQIGFLDERTMTVTVTDQGFGELFPSTGAVLRQEVML